jgi:hypothetical protein
MAASIDVKLDIAINGRELVAKLVFRNTGDADVLVLKDLLLLRPPYRRVFAVTADGQKVPYVGRLVKRAEPTREDYTALAPGAEHAASVRLDEDYQFPPRRSKCTAQYDVLNPLWDEPGFLPLKSNVAEFEYP